MLHGLFSFVFVVCVCAVIVLSFLLLLNMTLEWHASTHSKCFYVYVCTVRMQCMIFLWQTLHREQINLITRSYCHVSHWMESRIHPFHFVVVLPLQPVKSKISVYSLFENERSTHTHSIFLIFWWVRVNPIAKAKPSQAIDDNKNKHKIKHIAKTKGRRKEENQRICNEALYD